MIPRHDLSRYLLAAFVIALLAAALALGWRGL